MVSAPCLVCGSTEAWTVWRPRRDPYLDQLGLAGQDVRKVMCRRCGLVYSRPQLDAQEIARLYASFRESDRPTERHLAAKQQLAAEDFDWIRGRIDAPGHVLDIGCAEGSFLHRFQQAGWTCVGIEPSEYALFARGHYGLDVHRAVFETVAMPTSSVDLVTALRVLEHVADPRDVLIRIRTLLRPGGQLYLEVPDASKPRHRLGEFLGVQHLRLFTQGALTALLHQAGFAIVAVDGTGRGLRALVAAPDASRTTGTGFGPAPAPSAVVRLRAIYARHHARYLWKTRGRTALVATARRVVGTSRLSGLRRWLSGRDH